MNFRRTRWGSRVALCAAWLLVVQALLTGLSLGASAAPVQRDFFGNVICSEAARSGTEDGQPANPAHLPTCCVLGCSMAAAAAVPPPPAPGLPAARPAGRFVAPPSADERGARSAFRTPRNTRAPPASV